MEAKTKKQARIVVYDDSEFYAIFQRVVRAKGMTASGWFRWQARKFVKEGQDKL